MPVTPVPESRGALPYLVVKGASDAISFYERAFGAQVIFRLNAPNGHVMHAELQVGPSHFMLTEEQPQYGALSPATLGGSSTTLVIYVPDADTVFERALKAGAKAVMPMADQFWGDRAGNVVDPFGHQWMIATHIEDPSPQEIDRRAKALFADGNR